MRNFLHHQHPFRIFAFSGLATAAALVGVFVGLGAAGMTIAIILIAVEVAFSFDNAILNAKILSRMSRFWQNMFLTVGAAIAIFGMRIVFPILIVSITASLGWHDVLNLALNHPSEYAEHLEKAHPLISAFGGAFLLMLALHFFVDDSRKVLWFDRPERHLQRLASNWAPPLIAASVIAAISMLPFNHHKKDTLLAGLLGVAVYALIHFATSYFEKIQERQTRNAATHTGMAAFISFLYLEILDASFSFDGVLGAFAVTKEVVLIAVGLGVGALWVRSLTIFMVRRGTLNNYRYIEHGAHYTIGILALLLLVSLFYDVPEVIAGAAGLGVIGSSILASRQAMQAHKR
jgi:hypothetical protein